MAGTMAEDDFDRLYNPELSGGTADGKWLGRVVILSCVVFILSLMGWGVGEILEVEALAKAAMAAAFVSGLLLASLALMGM